MTKLYCPCCGEPIRPGQMVMISAMPTEDAVEVVRCKDCFANDCCSVQIDLNMGGEGYCPKGRKETRC